MIGASGQGVEMADEEEEIKDYNPVSLKMAELRRQKMGLEP